MPQGPSIPGVTCPSSEVAVDLCMGSIDLSGIDYPCCFGTLMYCLLYPDILFMKHRPPMEAVGWSVL